MPIDRVRWVTIGPSTPHRGRGLPLRGTTHVPGVAIEGGFPRPLDMLDDALRHTTGHVSKVTGERLDRCSERLGQIRPEAGHPGHRLVAGDVEVASHGAPVPLGDLEHAPSVRPPSSAR